MITYKSTTEFLPLFKMNEIHSKEEWMKKLNMNEEQWIDFSHINLYELDSQIKIGFQMKNYLRGHSDENDYYNIVITRIGSGLTKDEVDSITEKILNEFSDIVKFEPK